jgi:serine/threonine-protein kinase
MESGKYRIGSRIGGGGMAEVLEGELLGAEGFARPVAIKRMLPSLSESEAFGKMFVNEARIASLLHHANIAAVLDFDRDDDGTYYLVMELVRGVDLRELSKSGRLPVPVTTFIISEVLRGLAYAHELVHDGKHLGIVHRDVSPHNVLISWSGAVKVADFGIAKAVASTDASRDGSLKGKVSYMSPEQAYGQRLDGRSDLFAVGIMLHELLTGKRLFSDGTEAEILSRILNQPIPRPMEIVDDVPEDLDEIAMQLLRRNRDGRYLSASMALEDIVSCSTSSPRASLDLRTLLRQRFGGRIPPSADLSGATVAPALAEGSGDEAAPPAETDHTDGFATTAPAKPEALARAAAMDGEPASKPHSLWMLGALLLGAGLAAVLIFSQGKNRSEPSAARPASLEAEGPPATKRPGVVQVAERAAPARNAVAETASSGVVAGHGEANTEDKAAAAPADVEAAAQDVATASKLVADKPQGRGQISVEVKPWAEVWLGNRRIGITPQTIPAKAGKHRLRLRNPDLGKSERTRVEVRPGRKVRVRRDWSPK